MNAHPNTRVLCVSPENPEPDVIAAAAEVLRDGRLVAFPTETVYGLGANALDEAAIQRIYAAKQRPSNDPIIAHIANTDQLRQVAVDIPDVAYQLAERFWPGPLTLVLKRAAVVPAVIAAGLETIAVRMPSNKVARALIDAADVPVAAPSANTFTRPSATTAQHVLHDLGGRVDLVLDGGATTIGLESTVLDLTGGAPKILRPGGVTMDDLSAMFPGTSFALRYTESDEANVSPGQMLKHYAPNAQMNLFSGPLYSVLVAMKDSAARCVEAGQSVGFLVAKEDAPHLGDKGVVRVLGKRDDLKTISHNLFAAMRDLDELGVDVILARDFGRSGLGVALWDRLLRAAEGQIIDVR